MALTPGSRLGPYEVTAQIGEGGMGENFWLANLVTGEKRQLTKLETGYSVRSFDISADGKEILFDRVQENSDIVLIDLAR